MQSLVLSVFCTLKACPSNRVFGNEDVPLHLLGSSQLRTERMKMTNTAVVNILFKTADELETLPDFDLTKYFIN